MDVEALAPAIGNSQYFAAPFPIGTGSLSATTRSLAPLLDLKIFVSMSSNCVACQVAGFWRFLATTL